MAGHSTSLHEDPALLKYANLNKQRYRFFRWNKHTAKISFMYVMFVPFIVGSIAYATDGKYELRGKRRGDIASEY